MRERLADELRPAACRDDEPDLRVQPRTVRLRRDHRRRLRAERRSGPPPTTAPTSSATTRAARSSSSSPTAAAASRAPSSRPISVRSSTWRSGRRPAGQALYYTNYSNGGEVRRIEPTVVPNRAPTATMTATPTLRRPAARRELRRQHELRSGRRRHAHVRVELRRRIADGDDDVSDDEPHLHRSRHVHRDADRPGQPRRGVLARIGPHRSRATRPPQVTIDSPTASARFAVGETITLHATATDPKTGRCPPSSLSWRVLRHHDTHTHPFLAPTPGNDVTIQQPAPGGPRLGSRRLSRGPADGHGLGRRDDHGHP